MDLLDFEDEALYFEEPLSSPVSERLKRAADSYEQGTAELPLLQAYFIAPENLTVLVGLYRFYLLALKGAAYLQLRLEQIDEGIEMLEKILTLDSEDRLGTSLLLATAKERKAT
jgi:tetratricopeptide (TPR) repeat protein